MEKGHILILQTHNKGFNSGYLVRTYVTFFGTTLPLRYHLMHYVERVFHFNKHIFRLFV